MPASSLAHILNKSVPFSLPCKYRRKSLSVSDDLPLAHSPSPSSWATSSSPRAPSTPYASPPRYPNARIGFRGDYEDDGDDEWAHMAIKPQILDLRAHYDRYASNSLFLSDDEEQLPPTSDFDDRPCTSDLDEEPLFLEDEDEDDEFIPRPRETFFTTSAERGQWRTLPPPVLYGAHTRDSTVRQHHQHPPEKEEDGGASTLLDFHCQPPSYSSASSLPVVASLCANQQQPSDINNKQGKDEVIHWLTSPLPPSSPPLSPMSISTPSEPEPELMHLDDGTSEPNRGSPSLKHGPFIVADDVPPGINSNVNSATPLSPSITNLLSSTGTHGCLGLHQRTSEPSITVTVRTDLLDRFETSTHPPPEVHPVRSSDPSPTRLDTSVSSSNLNSQPQPGATLRTHPQPQQPLPSCTSARPDPGPPVLSVEPSSPDPSQQFDPEGNPNSNANPAPEQKPLHTLSARPTELFRNFEPHAHSSTLSATKPKSHVSSQTISNPSSRPDPKFKLNPASHPESEPKSKFTSDPTPQQSKSGQLPPSIAPSRPPAKVSQTQASSKLVQAKSMPGQKDMRRDSEKQKQPLANKKNRPHPGQHTVDADSASVAARAAITSREGTPGIRNRQKESEMEKDKTDPEAVWRAMGEGVLVDGNKPQVQTNLEAPAEELRERAEAVWQAMGEGMTVDESGPQPSLESRPSEAQGNAKGKKQGRGLLGNEGEEGPARKRCKLSEDTTHSNSNRVKERESADESTRHTTQEEVKDDRSKSKSKSKSRSKSRVISSPPRSSSPPKSSPTMSSPRTDIPELPGLLIESLATSRASSLPASALYKSVMESQPSLKVLRSKHGWIKVILEVLEDGKQGCGVFDKVDSSGKDESDRPLEAQWFYVPERDEDRDRAALIQSMMPRPGKRSETKKYKQYYWRPLEKMSRWDSEDEM